MLILEMISWIPNYLCSLPLHSQLAKTIRQKVHNDVLLCGHILPAAANTGAKLGVAAHIVRLAYEELQEDNIGNLQADGTFIIGIKMPFTKPDRFATGKQLSKRTRYY